MQRLLDRRSQKLTSKLKPIDWGDTKSIDVTGVNVLNEDNIQDDKVSLVKAMVNKLLSNVDPSINHGMCMVSMVTCSLSICLTLAK